MVSHFRRNQLCGGHYEADSDVQSVYANGVCVRFVVFVCVHSKPERNGHQEKVVSHGTLAVLEQPP